MSADATPPAVTFRAGRHLRVLQHDAPGIPFAVDGLLAHLDHPSLADTVVVAADHLAAPLDPVRAAFPGVRVVVWQLGQLTGGPTAHPVPRTIQHLRGADAVWDHDTLNIAYLAMQGVAAERVVPVLDPLRPLPPHDPEPTVDVLFPGRPTPRRERILERVARETTGRLRVEHVWGLEEEDLDRRLAEAKIVLNLHAFEPWHRQEQTRIARAIALGRMVVSEPSERNGYGPVVVEAREEHLAATLTHWLANGRWRKAGAAARDAGRARAADWIPVQGPRIAPDGTREEPPRRSTFSLPASVASAPPATARAPERVSQIWLSSANDTSLPPALEEARRTVLLAFPASEHRLWRMGDLRQFIGQHYPPEVLRAFDRLRPHAFKAKLGRFCVLHVLGGWYADIAIRFAGPPPPPPPGIDLMVWGHAATPSEHDDPLVIADGLLWARPGHAACRLVIERIVRQAEDRAYGEATTSAVIAQLAPRPDILIGDFSDLTPGRPARNRAYLMPDGTIVAWAKNAPSGDLTALGATGVNNHIDLTWTRQVYAPD